MTNSARRDPLRELALLVRAPEPGSSNLGEFLADNAGELAQVLGIDPRWLEASRATDDQEVVSRIRQLLARARDHRVQGDLERRRQRSLEAAERLGVTATWTDLGAELDVELLLGELLADRTKRWIAFTTDQAVATIVPRHLIAATAPLRRIHLDLASYVNATSLAFRWRSGRGGYTWRSHQVHPSLADTVLTVPLAPRVVLRVPERRRGGTWLVGHLLEELGYL
jgi:LmbE family N-acetylglucosaminyl deacetylase